MTTNKLLTLPFAAVIVLSISCLQANAQESPVWMYVVPNNVSTNPTIDGVTIYNAANPYPYYNFITPISLASNYTGPSYDGPPVIDVDVNKFIRNNILNFEMADDTTAPALAALDKLLTNPVSFVDFIDGNFYEGTSKEAAYALTYTVSTTGQTTVTVGANLTSTLTSNVGVALASLTASIAQSVAAGISASVSNSNSSSTTQTFAGSFAYKVEIPKNPDGSINYNAQLSVSYAYTFNGVTKSNKVKLPITLQDIINNANGLTLDGKSEVKSNNSVASSGGNSGNGGGDSGTPGVNGLGNPLTGLPAVVYPGSNPGDGKTGNVEAGTATFPDDPAWTAKAKAEAEAKAKAEAEAKAKAEAAAAEALKKKLEKENGE